MIDIQLIDNDQRVQFYKKLWSESEIVLAKCFSFHVDIDNGIIVATICCTARKALYDFIRVCYKNFSESESERYRRDPFYERLDVIYGSYNANALMVAQQNIPYFDQLFQHQKDVLTSDVYYKMYNFLAFEMGLGKAQPLHSKVLTPSGFVSMGEIQIGDKIIGSDGKSHAVHGVFPQGKIPYYKVNFSDGTSTECCDNHLWICRPINLPEKYNWRIKSLKELKDDLVVMRPATPRQNAGPISKWMIPQVKPVVYAPTNKALMPIHPYLLGILLGDGCVVTTVSISTNDHDELMPIIRPMLPDGMVIKKQKGENYSWSIVPEKRGFNNNTLLHQLRLIGLFNKKSHEKFVPDAYMKSSVKDRIELLQGLLDTDGHIASTGSRVSVTTCSPLLRDCIISLVQSLGGLAMFGEDIRDGKRTGFYIQVHLPNDIIPFKLPRRLARWRPKHRMLRRKIKSVEYIGETECQCIQVDSPDHSYVTDNFIVTHNTLTSASISRIHNVSRTVIMCPAAVKWNWVDDLVKFGFHEMWFTVLDSAKRRTCQAFVEHFVIVNYDVLEKFENYICSSDVGHFILDEAHLIKNSLSGRSKRVKAIVDRFPNARITPLSGTPISNRVDDVFNYLKLTGHTLGQNHKKFLEEFTLRSSGRGGERVTGGKNLQDLHLKLSNFMIRKTKEECLDLPDKIFMKYKFELDDYRTEYDKIIKEMSESKSVASLTGNIHSLNIITSKAKKKGIIDLAETIIGDGRKVVIFGGYKEPMTELEEYFGPLCVKIDGSVDSFTRNELVKQFIADPEIKVFLGNWIAAGVGINLVNSSDIIIQNFPLTPAALWQGVDRLHRIGQKNSVNVHFTMCEDSVDEHIFNIIEEKQNDINVVIDQGVETSMSENTVEILIKKLLKRDDITFNYDFKSHKNEAPGAEVSETAPKEDHGSGPIFSNIEENNVGEIPEKIFNEKAIGRPSGGSANGGVPNEHDFAAGAKAFLPNQMFTDISEFPNRGESIDSPREHETTNSTHWTDGGGVQEQVPNIVQQADSEIVLENREVLAADPGPQYHLMVDEVAGKVFILNDAQFDAYCETENHREIDAGAPDSEVAYLFSHTDINQVIMEGRHYKQAKPYSFNEDYTPNDPTEIFKEIYKPEPQLAVQNIAFEYVPAPPAQQQDFQLPPLPTFK